MTATAPTREPALRAAVNRVGAAIDKASGVLPRKPRIAGQTVDGYTASGTPWRNGAWPCGGCGKRVRARMFYLGFRGRYPYWRRRPCYACKRAGMGISLSHECIACGADYRLTAARKGPRDLCGPCVRAYKSTWRCTVCDRGGWRNCSNNTQRCQACDRAHWRAVKKTPAGAMRDYRRRWRKEGRTTAAVLGGRHGRKPPRSCGCGARGRHRRGCGMKGGSHGA